MEADCSSPMLHGKIFGWNTKRIKDVFDLIHTVKEDIFIKQEENREAEKKKNIERSPKIRATILNSIDSTRMIQRTRDTVQHIIVRSLLAFKSENIKYFDVFFKS
jgi:hypothetical protein